MIGTEVPELLFSLYRNSCSLSSSFAKLCCNCWFLSRQQAAYYPTWRHDMKKDTNFETNPLNTQDAKAEAAAVLTPAATNGEKIKALRTAQHMSMAELARRASMSDRAIRYIEAGDREPSVEAIQKIAAALGVTTDYFMDDATFQQELNDDLFYADVRKKYGSRGVAQAKKIKEQTTALFAGGELSEEDQAAFIKEMEALFLDAKEDAKKFTPKKYL